MKKKILAIVSALAVLAPSSGSFAAEQQYTEPYFAERAETAQTKTLYENRPVSLKQMEYLGRGAVAVKSDKGVLVSWRFLGTDAPDTQFNVYRDNTLITTTSRTNYLDADGTDKSVYRIDTLEESGNVRETSETQVQNNEYLSIPVKQYETGDYDINDASVGDLDGDGEYEIVVRRNPADMKTATRVAYPLLEAYRTDGAHLWTINIGPNEINDIDINFLVYDFDGDGKAEVVMRSYEGTTDGAGNTIGDVDGDGKTNYEDSEAVFNDRQYLSAGPEFISVYEGLTGKELARTELLPSREPLTAWGGFKEGDNRNVKRASHYLLTTAYLNGTTPSVVMVRGCWNAVGLAAWNFDGKDFKHLWTLPITTTNELDNLYNGGYHSIAVADIDFDGRDEILSGSMAVDDNGKFMYCTNVKGVKLGHGDAFDVAMMHPDMPGYLVWSCQENKNIPVNIGLHDARTGQVLMGFPKPKDTGRARAADIDPTNPGWEVWGSTGTPLMALDGTVLAKNDVADGANAGGAPVSMNMKLFWDGDLLSELFDYTEDGKTPRIEKWDWENKKADTIWTAEGCALNGGTKGQPCLIADIWGDWRDEILVRSADSKELRLYTTSIPTEYTIPTPMHDPQYRESVAWQNNHYNQPANTSYYMGAETAEVPVPEIYTIKSGEKIVNPVYEQNPNTHATIKIKTENIAGAGPSITPSQNGGKNKTVVMKINKAEMLVDNSRRNLDANPYISSAAFRTMVPLRAIADAFGAETNWNGDTQTVTVKSGDKTLIMKLGSAEYTINGEKKSLDAPPELVNDRTMLPLRVVAEAIDKQVYWDGERQLIVISEDASDIEDNLLDIWNSTLNELIK